MHTHQRNSYPLIPPPCHPCSMPLDEYLKILLLPHLQATTCRTHVGNLLQTTLRNAKWSSQYEHSS